MEETHKNMEEIHKEMMKAHKEMEENMGVSLDVMNEIFQLAHALKELKKGLKMHAKPKREGTADEEYQRMEMRRLIGKAERLMKYD